ncbi:MAG TPA: hypothetical protein VFQ38_18885 [Longimicrobiales bacterium]|nr:hypothetical protein [Longimicrobiales bacterium]
MLHFVLQAATESAAKGSDSAFEKPIWHVVQLAQDNFGLVLVGLVVVYGFYRYVIDVPRP